ncbi:MAG: hypothetical protein IJ692_06460 [Alloprevotella sp.]|nr:hypothetical protein [Alloprevotella sp.]MBR1653014.1 hypothetical protein [Alloprevotella sp.]
MKRALIITIVFCVPVFCTLSKLQAQTYYYKLDKIVRNGVPKTNTSGGQFITFNNRCCYESDKAGYSVGNGRLDYKYVENGLRVYYGDCYLGSNSTCLATLDLNTVNMKSGNVVYVYKRATPPSGITTCSLIKSASPPNPITISPIVGVGETTTTPNHPTPNNSTPKQTPTRHTCTLCHGSGTIIRETPTATYGKDTQRYCNNCGRSYWASSGHSHVTCSNCYGKGYY